MAEYIDREEYCEKYCRCSNEYCEKESCPIWKAPAADVAPVVHGRWVEQEDPMFDVYYTCSVCKEDFYIESTGDIAKDLFIYTYCPHCGARMEGSNEHETD